MKYFVLERESKIDSIELYRPIGVISTMDSQAAVEAAKTIVSGLTVYQWPLLRSPADAYCYRLIEIPLIQTSRNPDEDRSHDHQAGINPNEDIRCDYGDDD